MVTHIRPIQHYRNKSIYLQYKWIDWVSYRGSIGCLYRDRILYGGYLYAEAASDVVTAFFT